LSFSAFTKKYEHDEATVAQQAEQLICNQRVGGSIPFGGSTVLVMNSEFGVRNKKELHTIFVRAEHVTTTYPELKMERFPSGQREQTVNLPAQPSEVRILPSPLYELCKAKFVVRS
jgi:hypothetical protein